MAKAKKSYICNSCGAVHSRWSGKCDACGEWNCISEEVQEAAIPKGLGNAAKGRSLKFVDLKGESETASYPRYESGIKEFDRVCGGGLVPGSATLIGGDPGIGKSTILLQAMCALANKGIKSLYISGEEAVDQVRMRAKRLGLHHAPVGLANATNVRDIVASIEEPSNAASVVVIDSIQTMFVDTVDSAPGTVTQVRTSAQEIIRAAKARSVAVIFVGHVTKEGQIAGPRVLEHLVDTVLYFEGDRSHHFRILRGVKNRFGATDEIGVFEMAGVGLIEVENPSALFLSQRHQDVAGSAVLAALEGTRPILVEVQALVAQAAHGNPRRAVLGYDQNRLAMILAVLQTRLGLQFSDMDIFLNIAGGVRIHEPAADLAVAAALMSALKNQVLPPQCVFFGEIGLAGEIRAVAQADLRMKEASKLGFEEAYIPKSKAQKGSVKPVLNASSIAHIADMESLFEGGAGVRTYAA